jgi:hypothetical protein
LRARSARRRRLGEASLELLSAPSQLLDLLRCDVESSLQMVGESRHADNVIERLGREVCLVPEPALGCFVLSTSRFGGPLAGATAASSRRQFALIAEHAGIVAPFRA